MSNSANASMTAEQLKILSVYGYLIKKTLLNADQLNKVRRNLTVKPFTIAEMKPKIYKVYKETSEYIIVPYYYGVRLFGYPDIVKVPDGNIVPVALTYCGHKLRENQEPVVRAYMNEILRDKTALTDIKRGGILQLHTGFGKTLIALYLISLLKLKTLIIVNKEFLANQWLENIARCFPGANVGRIQGETIDIDGKDIVIGMLQSLSMKEYSPNTFSSFGFLIIDEVHHISSEVFSKTLMKIVIKYTLGLSATFDRNDGTSWVIKDYIGDIIYKVVKREMDYGVKVRAINYQLPSGYFNDVKKNFKGDLLYSCIISKLCADEMRTNFVIRVLLDALANDLKQQIMILSHNKNILDYIYNVLVNKNSAGLIKEHIIGVYNGDAVGDAATLPMQEIDNVVGNLVGFYVGGMKQHELKISESKRIILATYAMAAEALDIKTLTTLFLITPKTDIVQAVGRILRDKNDSTPVIYDFIDTQGILENQWRKRLAFYKKENYKIHKICSNNYNNKHNLWPVVDFKTIHDKKKYIHECLL